MTWQLNVQGHEETYSEETQREILKGVLDVFKKNPNVVVTTFSFQGNAVQVDNLVDALEETV